MYMAQAEIISDVIEEHFDEAAFLYQSRLQALASHRIGLSAFRRIEQRLLAHLDGLLVGGEMAWRLVEPNLQGPTRAAVAIAAYVACALGEDPYIEQLYAVLRDAPSPIFCGVRDALRHTGSHDAVDSLSRWLYAAHPSLRAAAVDALSFRRAEIPLNVLTELLADHSALVRQSATQAVGRLRLRSLTPRLRELFDDKESAVRDSALEAAALVGEPSVSERCKRLAVSGDQSAGLAFTLLGRLGEASAVSEVFAPELAKVEPLREAVLALGPLGDAQALPLLLPLAEKRTYAGLVTVVTERLLGVDLVARKIAAPPPPPQDPRDELDEISVEGLPICEPRKLAELLTAECARLPKSRLCLGTAYGPEPLTQLISQGPMAQRTSAAFELALQRPEAPYQEMHQLGL